MTQTELRAAADVHAQIWFQLDGSTMFTAAALHSLLMVALCLLSWAVPHGRHPGDLHREEKESSSSLMDRSRASDSSSLISSSQTSAADSTEAGDAHVPDSDFSSRPLDAPDTWTEADRLQTEEVSVSSPATMSSEDLPLIFEPFEDVTAPRASSGPSVAMTPAAVTMERMVSMDTVHTSSDIRLLGTKEPITEPHPEAEHHGTTQPGDDVTQRSVTHKPLTADPESNGLSCVQIRSAERLCVTEEPDEDEEEEEVDSDEEESEEDLTESTMAPPYSLIPPPPVWVQRNQGLVRSWVELIREKAGYVSGMLAPVGIGIAGALLLVGALYSIRAIHRRRNSFKHQRRKPPREVRSGPDNAMLLADSSEDEF
ncbi:armadillo-like helical domain-containing protein 4 isoform X1 [Carassius auratus]|uniref:Armadillo-like helical domain-containing protein 4 isoform X1 n=1 Tax=Carassius auratus TaxID=7957 RepID=A0A6P6P389_CARAU|nr:armadillo-like helical domain-containing protein 4 isoform X1 [Carassius auratus]